MNPNELTLADGSPAGDEGRLGRVLQGSRDGYWEWRDLSTNVFWWSPRFYEMLGYADGEFVPTSDRMLELFHPDDAQRARQRMGELLQDTEPFRSQYRMRSKSGSYVWIESRGEVFRNGDGQPHCVSGTVRDITQQREAETKLRESEETFRCMFDRSATSMVTVDLTGRILRVNDSTCQMLGYQREELLTLSFTDITAPEDLPDSIENFQNLIGGEKDYFSLEKRYKRKDGCVLWGTVTATLVRSADGAPLHVLAQLLDVTARKQAELALQKSEEWFRSLIELSTSVYAVTDREATIQYASPSVQRVLGWTPEEIVGTNGFARVHPDDATTARQAWDRVVECPGREESFEVRHHRKDGALRWVRMICANHLANDAVRGVVIASQDITASKDAQASLVKSQERFQSLFDNSPVALWEEDFSAVKKRIEELRQDGVTDFRTYFEQHPESVAECAQLVRVLDVNRAALHLHGAESKDQLVANLAAIFTEKSYTAVRAQLVAIAEGLTKYECEASAKSLDGREVETALRWEVVPGCEESLERVHLSTIDITARKRTELRLRESEQKFRTVFNQQYLFIAILTPDGRVLEVNDLCLKMQGASREEYDGQYFWDTPAWRELPEWQEKIRGRVVEAQTADGPIRTEDVYRFADGTIRCADAVCTGVRGDDGELRYIVMHAQDTTERRQAAEELALVAEQRRRAAEELATHKEMLEQAESIAQAGCWEWTLDTNRAVWSAPMSDVFGVGYREPSYEQIRSLIHPEDVEWWEGYLKEMVEHTSEPFDIDYRICRPDGAVAWIHNVAKVLRDDRGRPLKMIGMSQDVTQRRHAEKVLQKSEETFRSLFDQSPIAIQLYDESGRLVDVNQRTLDLFGVDDKQRLLGYVMWDSPDYTPERIAQVKSGHSICISTELDFGRVKQAGLFPTSKTGVLHLDMLVCPLTVAGAISGYTVQLVDLTERRNVETHLRHAQKMESIGRLAGGIAHDFNNILMPILGYVEMVMQTMDKDQEAYAQLACVQEAADRAKSLTRQILAFSRKQVLQTQVLSLNDVVADFEEMLRRLIGEDVQLAVRLADGLRLVEVDPRQIEQVLMNLAINSRDAMPRGGRLTIETANTGPHDSDAGDEPPGRSVMLAVTDTGHGMDAATRERVFEPFFTTKEQGKGSGLGLSTTFGIVKQHGGAIRVESQPGAGASFRVYLPIADAAGRDDEPAASELDSMHGTETVLLVEDDKLVRRMVSQTLSSLGYEVLETAHPDEALRLAIQRRDDIHLLLTDVIMPGMSGAELYRRVAESTPAIKVLYMSGYTDDAIVHHGVLTEGVPFLQKPFRIRRLGQMVRQALEQHQLRPDLD
ncbi:Blue-light-activated protein [Posidoniimonas corsicana]|uniref:histidine kinase n=1 Tax=Posidoniimonas corsicana TaxID=1938618 RepID=A0A5C5V1Q1_9BACT|nr:PAS domain S-box protein [Posidoniimonas corsicana]TWT32321.1 Blue-light-activated protein [Posidoniimonas corsicana]